MLEKWDDGHILMQLLEESILQQLEALEKTSAANPSAAADRKTNQKEKG